VTGQEPEKGRLDRTDHRAAAATVTSSNDAMDTTDACGSAERLVRLCSG